MPKGINILGSYCLFLSLSLSLYLSLSLSLKFLQHSISNWHNSWSIWRNPSILGSYEKVAVGE